VLDRSQPGRDPTLATRRGHPRGNTRAARLDPRTRPPHLWITRRPAHLSD